MINFIEAADGTFWNFHCDNPKCDNHFACATEKGPDYAFERARDSGWYVNEVRWRAFCSHECGTAAGWPVDDPPKQVPRFR